MRWERDAQCGRELQGEVRPERPDPCAPSSISLSGGRARWVQAGRERRARASESGREAARGSLRGPRLFAPARGCKALRALLDASPVGSLPHGPIQGGPDLVGSLGQQGKLESFLVLFLPPFACI